MARRISQTLQVAYVDPVPGTGALRGFIRLWRILNMPDTEDRARALAMTIQGFLTAGGVINVTVVQTRGTFIVDCNGDPIYNVLVRFVKRTRRIEIYCHQELGTWRDVINRLVLDLGGLFGWETRLAGVADR